MWAKEVYDSSPTCMGLELHHHGLASNFFFKFSTLRVQYMHFVYRPVNGENGSNKEGMEMQNRLPLCFLDNHISRD